MAPATTPLFTKETTALTPRPPMEENGERIWVLCCCAQGPTGVGAPLRSRQGLWTHASIELDPHARRVRQGGRDVPLTRREFDLLAFFVRHMGRVFSRQELLQQVWGRSLEGAGRTVDIHLRRLRAKLGTEALGVVTLPGVGYVMRSPSS